jgi:SAM-dependent methyltransferase
VQVVPQPSQKEIRLLYRNDWKHFAPYQSQTDAHRTYFQTLFSFIFPLHNGRGLPRVLDVGSATGVFLSLLKKKGIRATGVDVSRDAVSYCRNRGLEAYEGTLFEIAKEKKWKGVFDAVFACQVIEHENDPFTFLKTMKRIIKPNGIVVITTPNHDTVWRRIMGKRWIGYQHPEHLFFFTPETLINLMHAVGLTVSLVRPDFSRPYNVGYAFRRLGDYIPKLYWFFRPFERLFQNVQISVPFNPWGDFLAIGRL